MQNDIITAAETILWHRDTLAARAVSALEKNNMTALYVKTGQEAASKALSLIPYGSEVSFGGSLTLEQIGITDNLRTGNYRLIDRRKPGLSPSETDEVRRKSAMAEYFLMSANAITLDGKLVNIDLQGNRIAGLIFGAKKVIVVAGVNKIVPDEAAARQRIKEYVTPIHAHRRNYAVPCARTGTCVDCRVTGRLCNIVSIVEHQEKKDRITVIICGEELGL